MLLHPPPAVQFKLPGAEDATQTPPPWGAEAAARHAKKGPTAQYFGSFKSPQHADDAMTAALNGEATRVHHAEDFLISLILVAIVLFAAAMASFFWRKYRSIHLSSRSPSAFEYSQLSQSEREGADLSEIADDLGMSINTSTDEEDLEPACPATISVTASYVTNLSSNSSSLNNNNEDEEAKHQSNANLQRLLHDDDLLDMPVTPDASLPAHLQAPLQPSSPPATVAVPMFLDSDEELLQ